MGATITKDSIGYKIPYRPASAPSRPQWAIPVAAEIDGRLYAIHTDQLNTPRQLTDAQGKKVWQWAISGFGEVEPTTAETGWIRPRNGTAGPRSGTLPVTFNLRFPGQQFDEESGLHYNHHRYYDPYLTVGYTEADPLGLSAGWNRFAYVDGDPLGAVDPEGLKAWFCQRPLGGKPGRRGLPLLNHQYVCATTQGGNIVCSGLTTDGNMLSSEGRLTRPDEDYYDPISCKLTDDDEDQCVEQCILRNFQKTNLPRYGIGPFTDCQEYADNIINGCRMFCAHLKKKSLPAWFTISTSNNKGK